MSLRFKQEEVTPTIPAGVFYFLVQNTHGGAMETDGSIHVFEMPSKALAKANPAAYGNAPAAMKCRGE